MEGSIQTANGNKKSAVLLSSDAYEPNNSQMARYLQEYNSGNDILVVISSYLIGLKAVP